MKWVALILIIIFTLSGTALARMEYTIDPIPDFSLYTGESTNVTFSITSTYYYDGFCAFRFDNTPSWSPEIYIATGHSNYEPITKSIFVQAPAWGSGAGSVQHTVYTYCYNIGSGRDLTKVYKNTSFILTYTENPKYVASQTPTPTPTSTVTGTPIIYVTPVSTPEVTPIATPIVTPIMTTTPTEAENGKVAILQVIYNIGRKDNKAEVTVSLKNVGSSTAKFVKLSMDVPVGLGAILDSGAEMDGNTIVWTGDIEPGREHVIKYLVGAPKTDIEIPVKVTYINSEKTLNKVMAKASAQGMSVSAMAIDPQDLQTILLVIQIAKSLTSGFEIILAITGIGAIYIIRKVKIRP